METIGKIAAVGARGDVAVPDGADAVDLDGAVVIPGLVDTPSHIGLWGRPGVGAPWGHDRWSAGLR